MDKTSLEQFLLKARAKTYAAATGKTEPLLPGSVQYEYAEDGFLYRDIYYIGNGIFPGLETIFYEGKPVWSMAYYGDFSKMTEKQIDSMLRRALIDSQETTRIYHRAHKDYEDFSYACNGQGVIDKLSGTEEIRADGEVLYVFQYAGGYIGQ